MSQRSIWSRRTMLGCSRLAGVWCLLGCMCCSSIWIRITWITFLPRILASLVSLPWATYVPILFLLCWSGGWQGRLVRRAIRGLRDALAKRSIVIMLSLNNVGKVWTYLKSLKSNLCLLCRNWNVQFYCGAYFELLSWCRDVYILCFHEELDHVQHLWTCRRFQLSRSILSRWPHLTWKYIQLDTFWAGFILLGGLFFYDIFFVFGTNVMVTVAISMDVPIKVPR